MTVIEQLRSHAQSLANMRFASLVFFIVASTAIHPTSVHAQEDIGVRSRKARVSPVLEIEVVDPNRDPRGNPAVVLKTDEAGNQTVDIPPSLIVHRYYYTGDRSFQGPDLPGGPSIIVVQNPRSGQQEYLPVQLLPGAPRVQYTSHAIEYDYGNHAVIISFPHHGAPVVSYRNGRPLTERVSHTFGLQHVSKGWRKTTAAMTSAGEHTSTVVQAAHNAAGSALKPLTLPAQNLSRLLPGSAAISDPQFSARVTEESALRKRDAEIRKNSHFQGVDQVDLPR